MSNKKKKTKAADIKTRSFTVYDGGDADESVIETLTVSINREFSTFRILIKRSDQHDRLKFEVSRYNGEPVPRTDHIRKVARFWLSGFVRGCRLKGGE